MLASDSFDITVKLWDIASCHEIMTLSGYSDRLWKEYSVLKQQADFLRDIFSKETNIKKVDIESAEFDEKLNDFANLFELEQKFHNLEAIIENLDSKLNCYLDNINFSHDGRLLVGNFDGLLKIWNIEEGTVRTLYGHNEDMNSVVFSSDNKLLVSGNDDNTIKLWDVESGNVINTLRAHSKNIQSLNLNLDSKKLLSGDGTKYILWYLNLENFWEKESSLLTDYTQRKMAVRLKILQRELEMFSQKLMNWQNEYVIRWEIFQNADHLVRQESNQQLKALQREYDLLAKKFERLQNQYTNTTHVEQNLKLEKEFYRIENEQKILKKELAKLEKLQKFDPLLCQEIRDLLIHHFNLSDANWRRALLLYAFGIDERMLNIDFKGESRNFLSRLLRHLIEQDVTSYGQNAFILFFEAIASIVGTDTQEYLQTLRDWLLNGAKPSNSSLIHLESHIWHEIVNFMIHLYNFGQKEEYRNLMSSAGLREFEPYLDYSGSPKVFMDHLLNFLDKYGVFGRVALMRLLKEAEKYVGQDKRETISSFYEQLRNMK